MNIQDGRLTVTVVGAGGKMGFRVTNNLVTQDYNLLLCEKGEGGIQRLKEIGLEVTNTEEALESSDVVIMAVPDTLLGSISEAYVPMMKEDATMIILDPAAAYARELALRDDCTFVAIHPCHPALYTKQDTDEARADFFGGIAAKQDIVSALIQGKEEKLDAAEKIGKEMYAPVNECYRVTIDQMAFLEPAVSEIVGATCASIMKETVDEAVKYGIPRAAAESFLLGHINVLVAIYFGKIPAPVSDACKIAVDCGYDLLFKEDWKKIFKEEVIKDVVNKMLDK